MPKVIKIAGLLVAFLVFSFKSFSVLNLDFKTAYVTSSNMDSGVDHKEDGLLFGGEVGLGFYFPLLSSISVGADYHNMNFKQTNAGGTIKANMLVLNASYNVLGIVPFVNPYVSAGLALDLGNSMFNSKVFEESVTDDIYAGLYKTSLMNLMLAAGLEVDGFTMFVPIIPYVEYRTYLMGVELYNAARESIGKESSLVQSVMFGLQYRF